MHSRRNIYVCSHKISPCRGIVLNRCNVHASVWRMYTNAVQYLSLERDNAERYLNTLDIGATGKKLWKLVRQANSTGTTVARITPSRSNPYKYVYGTLLGETSYTYVIISAMQNATRWHALGFSVVVWICENPARNFNASPVKHFTLMYVYL